VLLSRRTELGKKIAVQFHQQFCHSKSFFNLPNPFAVRQTLCAKKHLNLCEQKIREKMLMKSAQLQLGPLQIIYFCTQYSDKKILRNVTIFSNRFLFTKQGKLLAKPNPRYVGFLRAYLGRSLKPKAQNYRMISRSFYLFIQILCAKISSVFWA